MDCIRAKKCKWLDSSEDSKKARQILGVYLPNEEPAVDLRLDPKQVRLLATPWIYQQAFVEFLAREFLEDKKISIVYMDSGDIKRYMIFKNSVDTGEMAATYEEAQIKAVIMNI